MFGNRGKPQPIAPVSVEFIVWTEENIDPAAKVTDDDIRRIVREEIAEIVPVDVPDALPEDLR